MCPAKAEFEVDVGFRRDGQPPTDRTLLRPSRSTCLAALEVRGRRIWSFSEGRNSVVQGQGIGDANDRRSLRTDQAGGSDPVWSFDYRSPNTFRVVSLEIDTGVVRKNGRDLAKLEDVISVHPTIIRRRLIGLPIRTDYELVLRGGEMRTRKGGGVRGSKRLAVLRFGCLNLRRERGRRMAQAFDELVPSVGPAG